MNGKPVILYVESAYGESHDPNSNREALSFFLRNDCGCEVHLYDYQESFIEDKESIIKLVRGGWVILVIFKQHRYMEREHLDGIEFVRTQLSPDLPIVILPDWHEGRFQLSAETPNVYTYDHEDQELTRLVKRLASAWIKPEDAFGVENEQERDLLCKHLENAYKTHYLNGNDEDILGTPDPNTQIVFEALRLRLLPASFLREEFDATLPRRPACFDTMDASVYEQEVNKIQLMTEVQRKELDDDMVRARGMIPCKEGGVLCTGVGQGDKAWGFAIDWLTLQNVICDRFGEHQLAKYHLLEQLKVIEVLRTGESPVNDEKIEYPCARRILFGLILNPVNGFRTPLACMWSEGADPEQCQKVADHLLKEKRFIPVTPDGYIFGTHGI